MYTMNRRMLRNHMSVASAAFFDNYRRFLKETNLDW